MQILQQQEVSGLSIAAFCRRKDVSPPSFYSWRRRLRAEAPPTFVELKAEALQSTALELVLPGGWFRGRVLVHRGFDHQALRELLAALESPA